jgi:hypothetical protein
MYFAIVLTLTPLENYIKKVIFWDGRNCSSYPCTANMFYFSSVSRSFYPKKKGSMYCYASHNCRQWILLYTPSRHIVKWDRHCHIWFVVLLCWRLALEAGLNGYKAYLSVLSSRKKTHMSIYIECQTSSNLVSKHVLLRVLCQSMLISR